MNFLQSQEPRKIGPEHPLEGGKLRSAGTEDIISYREIIMGGFFSDGPWYHSLIDGI